MKHRPLFQSSIKLRLPLQLLAVTLPLIACLLLQNIYSINMAREQTATLSRNTTALYMQQIDYALESSEKYLANLATNLDDLHKFEQPTTENEGFLAQSRLQMRMSEGLLVQGAIDGIFLYSVPSGRMVSNAGSNTSPQERRTVEEAFKSLLSGAGASLNTREWYPLTLEDGQFLVRLLKVSQSYVGAWCSNAQLLPFDEQQLFQEIDTMFFSSPDGAPMGVPLADFQNQFRRDNTVESYAFYTNPQSRERYMVIGTPSGRGGFLLLSLIREQSIVEKLNAFQRINLVLTTLIACCVPLLIAHLNRRLIRPLDTAVAAMGRLRRGDLNARITGTAAYKEICIVNDSFNEMAGQIEQLKIDVYEQKLRRQHTEMQFLQSQIRPHFFANALNVVHTLVEAGRRDKATRMLKLLTLHFRYVMRPQALVPLGDEMEHVHNYLEIQSIRYHNRLLPVFTVADDTLATPVPPLLLQTFVENAFKYAVPDEGPIVLHLRCAFEGGELFIRISDSGPGFPAEVLEALEQGGFPEDRHGGQIGLSNLRSRLAILYGGRFHMCFSNNPGGGACIEIRLPACQEEEVPHAEPTHG